MKTWIVLHHPDNGGRFASFPNTPDNLRALKTQCRLDLIQRDADGTEHYSASKR